MDKEDALVIFTEHIRQLEQDEDEEKHNEKKRQLREKRKNRERFIEFLDELNRQGKLTCVSKWCNLYQEISADPRYYSILKNLTGSTPLDLFKFYVHNLKRRYDEDKQIIKQIIKDKQFQITYTTTFDDFLQLLKEHEQDNSLDLNNIKMMYEKLIDREKERERERQKELNKSKRKIESQFINLLSKVEPSIDENTDWESVRIKIEDEDIFNEFNETERLQLFKSYLQSLEESCSHHHSKSRKQKKLKKSKYVHSSSESISSDMELDQHQFNTRDNLINNSEDNSNLERKKFKKHHHHHHHKSRSHSGSVSSNKRSRSPLSRSPIYEKNRNNSKKDRHLDVVNSNIKFEINFLNDIKKLFSFFI